MKSIPSRTLDVTRTATVILLGVALWILAGCGGGLKLTPIKSTSEKPSNVAVYFKVEASNGEPIGGLKADQFKIYEDGALVSQFESKQTILNPEVAASHYTMLLIDMSGSISESGSTDSVVEAATAFTQKVEKYQKVGVYAFDGSDQIYPIAPFTNSAASATAGIKSLKGFKAKDPSTNLHGAVIKGMKELETALSHAEHPMRFGTLVVFTDGSDRAGRVSNDDMRKAVSDTQYDVFGIGLGVEIKEDQIKQVGKNGTAMAQDKNQVTNAFDTIAKRIESQTKAYYLLSYCSPSRAGEHEVEIEAIATDADGKTERKGRLSQRFDATGFGPNCDPNRPPKFDTSKGDALSPKDKDEPKKTSGSISVGTDTKKSSPPPSNQPKPVKPGDDFNP
ncbi:MAG: VWA domain-containing protein [Deltaproteobacteria bacterium]|nr:VWA domain-containing protein [Deltaproteobacteria bacterium]